MLSFVPVKKKDTVLPRLKREGKTGNFNMWMRDS